MCVVAYVSGHGYGHAAREAEVLRRLPVEIPLTVVSASREWFWRQEMGRPFEFREDAFDVGCIQKDALAIDVPGTLAAWNEVDARNRARLTDEVLWLRWVGARLVVSDVPAFPLEAAREASMPGVLVANFTWADIYAGLAADEPAFGPIAERLRDQYAAADPLLLEAGLGLPMPYLPRRESVGVVSRPGSDRRADLLALLGPAAQGKRLALLYVGAFGMPLPYERLAEFDGWHFLSLAPLPGTAPNLTFAEQDWMPHPDLVASVDVVVSKLGYGIVGECLGGGTAILFPPRPGFAEHPVLEAEVRRTGHGVPLDTGPFLSLDWAAALAAVPAHGTLPCLAAPGGARAAERIADLYRASGQP